jgi:hypothetical protein
LGGTHSTDPTLIHLFSRPVSDITLSSIALREQVKVSDGKWQA